MHPDRKIGIAMGILLVGVVAALFFRNEPLAVDEGLSSIREQQLNQKLRDRDVSVYLDPDIDSLPDEQSDEPAWTLPELLDQVRHSNAVPTPIAPATPVVEPQPEDIVVERDPARFAPPTPKGREKAEPNPATDRTQGVADFNPASQQPQTSQKSSTQSLGVAGNYQEYTVQFGDTLSEISEKFLGSQNRYREIYELNKDRMSSPDRLKVGHAIRVPRQHH